MTTWCSILELTRSVVPDRECVIYKTSQLQYLKTFVSQGLNTFAVSRLIYVYADEYGNLKAIYLTS